MKARLRENQAQESQPAEKQTNIGCLGLSCFSVGHPMSRVRLLFCWPGFLRLILAQLRLQFVKERAFASDRIKSTQQPDSPPGRRPPPPFKLLSSSSFQTSSPSPPVPIASPNSPTAATDEQASVPAAAVTRARSRAGTTHCHAARTERPWEARRMRRLGQQNSATPSPSTLSIEQAALSDCC